LEAVDRALQRCDKGAVPKKAFWTALANYVRKNPLNPLEVPPADATAGQVSREHQLGAHTPDDLRRRIARKADRRRPRGAYRRVQRPPGEPRHLHADVRQANWSGAGPAAQRFAAVFGYRTAMPTLAVNGTELYFEDTGGPSPASPVVVFRPLSRRGEPISGEANPSVDVAFADCV
jgi:hypothetical protein